MHGGIQRRFRPQTVDAENVVEDIHPVVRDFLEREAAQKAAEAAHAAEEHEERLYACCIHEAGHAITTIALREPYHSVIVHGPGSGGFRQYKPVAKPAAKMCFRGVIDPFKDFWGLHQAAISLAGLAAELKTQPGPSNFRAGCQTDINNIHELLDDICSTKAQKDFLIWHGNGIAHDLVNKHWLIIETLARELQARRFLDRDQIIAAVRRAPGGYDLLGEEPPLLVRHRSDQQSSLVWVPWPAGIR
jgi:hypothetical protein